MNGRYLKPVFYLGVFMALAPSALLANPAVPTSGTAPYTTNFVFVPKSTVDMLITRFTSHPAPRENHSSEPAS